MKTIPSYFFRFHVVKTYFLKNPSFRPVETYFLSSGNSMILFRDFFVMLENFHGLHILLEESKHSFNAISLTETWLNDHEFKTNSNYRLPNTTKFIMKGKLTKEEVGFLCVLGMTSRIKFETIYVVLIAIEKFSQLNYSQKA